MLVENRYVLHISSSFFRQKQNVAKFGNDDASGWHQRLPYAKKMALLTQAELELPTQCKACRFYHDQHCLAWLVRDFLGLQQPVDMWEVMVSAVAEFDNRKYICVSSGWALRGPQMPYPSFRDIPYPHSALILPPFPVVVNVLGVVWVAYTV